MKQKIEEYIEELNAEIDRCIKWSEENINKPTHMTAKVEGRIQALTEVKNDLQGRLNEL